MEAGRTLGWFAGFHAAPNHKGQTRRSKLLLEVGCSELAPGAGSRGEDGWEVKSRPGGTQKILRGNGGAGQFTPEGLGELLGCVLFPIVLKDF